MSQLNKLTTKDASPDTHHCEGRVYRFTENTYISKAGALVSKMTGTWLRRKSCKGCDRCAHWIEDLFQEAAYANCLEMPATGGLYRLSILWYDSEYVEIDWVRIGNESDL